MEHRATTGFWEAYFSLRQEIRSRADKQFLLLKANPQHPSLQFKKIGDRQGNEIWSARISLSYRALPFVGPMAICGSGLVIMLPTTC